MNYRPNFEFVKYPTLLCWHWCCYYCDTLPRPFHLFMFFRLYRISHTSLGFVWEDVCYRLTLCSWNMHIEFGQCWSTENTELPGKWYGACLTVSVYSKIKAGRLRDYDSIPATDTFLSCTPPRPMMDPTLCRTVRTAGSFPEVMWL